MGGPQLLPEGVDGRGTACVWIPLPPLGTVNGGLLPSGLVRTGCGSLNTGPPSHGLWPHLGTPRKGLLSAQLLSTCHFQEIKPKRLLPT